MRIRPARGLLDFLLRGVRHPVGDVVTNGIVEQDRVLAYYADP